jgi:site-specific DNA-methyltransferase (adenine-specific)
MSKMKVHFSSATDDWATPQAFFDEMNKEFGPFIFDVCASSTNTKCREYFGKGSPLSEDGLSVPWRIIDTKTKCWMNPPYGRTIGLWVKKAFEESAKGCTVVCLLPARTDTKWFHNYIYNNPRAEIRFIKGRLKFGGAKNAAPFPSMVVIFHSEQA